MEKSAKKAHKVILNSAVRHMVLPDYFEHCVANSPVLPSPVSGSGTKEWRQSSCSI